MNSPLSPLFQALNDSKAARLFVKLLNVLVFLLGLASYDESSYFLTISEHDSALLDAVLLNEPFPE